MIESDGTAADLGWLPETARRVLLVVSREAEGGPGRATLEMAELVASHRPRTLLVSLATDVAGAGDLTDLEQGGRGLSEVVRGECRVKDVAAHPPGRSFLLVPAGATPMSAADLGRSPAFRHLLDAGGRGGTLLLVAEADQVAELIQVLSAHDGPGFDGLVLLGTDRLPAGVPPGIRVLARVEVTPSPSGAGPAARPSTAGTGGFSRAKGTPAIVAESRAQRRPTGGLAAWIARVRQRDFLRGAGGVVVVWLAAILAVWLVWQGLSGWPAFQEDLDEPSQASTMTQPPPGTPREQPVEATAEDTAIGAVETSPPGEVGVELPYSVLVASSVAWEDAAAKRNQVLRAGELAFVAPTPVRGRLYYRVFAGALEDREEARALMARLVEDGIKERERDWDMRPTTWALSLGEYRSREDADAERDRLHEAGLPAYVLSVGDSTEAAYRLYSGAYESEAASAPADSILSAAGLGVTLVARRGEPS